MLSGLITAAGVGSRMNNATPKQYLEINGEAVLSRAIRALQSVHGIKRITVVLDAGDSWWPALPFAHQVGADLFTDLPAEDSATDATVIDAVVGGETRAHSVLSGLQHLRNDIDEDCWVLVHDAARPLVRQADMQRLVDAVIAADVCGGLLAVPATDTLKEVDNSRKVTGTLDRRHVWQAQTPQMFRVSTLADAIADGLACAYPLTDEASAMELRGHQPLIVEGSVDNIKITHPTDLQLAEILLQKRHGESQ